MMHARVPGNSGLEVSAIGLGCMDMSFGYGEAAGRGAMIALLRAAVLTVRCARYPEALQKRVGL